MTGQWQRGILIAIAGLSCSFILVVIATFAWDAAIPALQRQSAITAAELQRQSAIRAEELQKRSAISAAEAYITQNLSDPDSAKFGTVIAVKMPDGGTVVCGTVNAKNKFGGYTGGKAFYYNGKIGEIAEPVFNPIFGEPYKYCGLTVTGDVDYNYLARLGVHLK